ncbi:hypothetical protein MHYP_G00047040 [Metynnis hypsauchen]
MKSQLNKQWHSRSAGRAEGRLPRARLRVEEFSRESISPERRRVWEMRNLIPVPQTTASGITDAFDVRLFRVSWTDGPVEKAHALRPCSFHHLQTKRLLKYITGHADPRCHTGESREWVGRQKE